MNSVVRPPLKRPHVMESWQRSRLCGLDRGLVPDLPYDPNFNTMNPLARAAAPVLDRLETMLAGMENAIVLLDQSGKFLMSRCDDRSLQARLDRGQSAPGFVWAEEYAGANAVAIAIEDRVPMWMTGADHYLEMLHDLGCAAAPVVNPFTRRLEGVIDLAARAGKSSPLMLPVALWAAAAIEDRLLEQGSVSERVLLDHFLAARRRPGRVIMVRGDRTELSTSNATSMLSSSDTTLLAQRADDVAADDEVLDHIRLSSGREALARFEGISSGGRRIGVLIEVLVDQSRSTPRRTAIAAPAPVSIAARNVIIGRSQASGFLRAKLDQLAGSTFPLVISGESGSGKWTLGQVLAGENATTFDATATAPDAEATFISDIERASRESDAAILVRQVGALSAAGMQRLGTIAESAESHGSRLICTLTERDGSGAGTPATFGVRVHVPALRERPEDVLDLTPHLLARRELGVRVAAPVMQVLMRYDWPGNIRELDSVLTAMAASSRGGEIVLKDVPPHYQRGARRLRRIEHMERNAIMQALQESGGNKTQAAETLEIGRATLYRKMRVYGLESDLAG